MLNRYARAFFTRVLTPVARALVRAGVSPDVVTLVGTLGVCAGALAFYPRHQFFVGTVVITAFVFSDLVDGTMARMTERSSRWGAFLDSTLDRAGDGAIFGGLVLWFGGRGHDPTLAAVALFCLVSGALVSYAKARAEGLGMRADVGIAERADRLVVVLVATGLDGLGVPYIQAVSLWALAVASVVTLGQRIALVRRQALAEAVPVTGPVAGPAAGPTGPGPSVSGSSAEQS
jgi:CDP-diacylglycerol--glycerol-3-phosphate 3-phosphatidyltransferase